MEGGSSNEKEDVSLQRKRQQLGREMGPIRRKNKKPEINSFPSCLDEPADLNSVHEVVVYETSNLSVKNYEPDTTEPISSGLKSLDELLSWQRSEASPFNVATVPMAGRHPSLASCQRRTLVCHDMMGGYLEDRFIQGAEVDTPYAFYHWEYIDIFNYFSHNMVTIPPAGWTNSAHKHGVLVLGTFITEWTDGSTTCEAFLADEEAYRAVADKLVQIAHCYGFDGWLINIENVLSEKAVKNTPLFLRYLTDQVHERVHGGVVLWYDSVLEDGSLIWQNELNERNRVFFDACDGIFTNYNWTEQSLEGMRSYSAAEGRLADIFVGVDVFARGKVVGGKFETNKAMELIRRYDLSAAIFAPGWVYECHDKKDFRINQDKFWGLLSDFLYIHRPSSQLPFSSSLCQGFGRNFYWKGKVEESGSWFNLNAQEVQPLYVTEAMEGKGWLKTRGCPQDAWIGGCSLLVEGMIPSTRSSVCARIFSLHVPLASRTLVSFIYKPSEGVTASLQLKTTDAALCSYEGIENVPSSSIQPQPLGEEDKLVGQFIRSCGEWMPESWTLRCFLLELKGCALQDICVNISRQAENQDVPFQCRIGEIMVLDAESLSVPSLAVESVCLYDIVWQKSQDVETVAKLHLSATLQWHYPARLVRYFRIHWRRLGGPPGPLTLIRRAYSTLFRVFDLAVPNAPSMLELLVEPVSREGFSVPEWLWGRRVLSYAEGPLVPGQE